MTGHNGTSRDAQHAAASGRPGTAAQRGSPPGDVPSSSNDAGRGTSLTAGTALDRLADLKQALAPVEQLIARHPAVSLASAFALGAALAWWIKRK